MADTDVRVGIQAVDLGATRLIRSLVDALRLLNTEQAKQARATRIAADAAQNSANSLQARANVYRVLAEQEKQRTRDLQEQSRARMAQIKAERDAEVRAAKEHAARQNEFAQGFVKMQQARVNAAKAEQADRLGLTPGVDKFLAAQVAARERELTERIKDAARAHALGEQQIAQARRIGAAEEASIARQVRGQQTLAASRVKQAQVAATAARQAQSNARAEERAAARAAAAYARQAQIMNTIKSRTDDIRNRILRLAAAYSGFKAIEGFIGSGLRFNQILESSRLGIGALITAQAELVDQNGELLTGTTALAAAQSLAGDQLNKLRVAGIQTAATTEDLVTSFEEAVGAGLAVGLNLDQIRQFTVSIAQAASAIHLPMNQLQQETRSILQGTIDRNSRIAKALQLTNEEIRLAKEQGRLAQLLEERFKAFNVAGAESVKTFGALRSNIADAFSVFAGRATEPLFTQLRDAAFEGLSKIFDFRSADIAESFKGLVSGLQTIFNEIGGMLADSIALAVNKAEALSRWMAENRAEVKATAAAVRTMVEDFGRLLASVVSLLGSLGGMARETNAIIGLARLLSALFQSLADNMKLIVSLLAGRALYRGITQLAALASTIGAVTNGAKIGSLFGPVGTAIGTIIALGTAWKIFSGFQREAALEAARTTSAVNEQRIAAADLLGQITSLERQLTERGNSAEQTASLEAQLAAAIKQVADLGPEYKASIESGTEALKERLQLQLVQAQTDAWIANAQLVQLRKARDEAAKPRVIPGQGVGRLAREPRIAVDTARLEEANAALETQQALVNTLQGDVAKLEETLTKALEVPAKVQPRRVAKTDEQLNKDINDAVQRAQAELDALREFNQRSRDIVDQEVKNGLTSAISQIEQEKQMALTELSAEMAVAQAQLAAARNRRVEGKVVPDLGAIEAAEIRIQSLIQQRFILEQETEGKRTALRREQAAARAKIEEDHLRAIGNRFEAARLEIERKFQEQLTEAIREFGEGSEEVIKLRVTIDQESMREQAEVAQQEIKRIEEARDREVENARFRILGPVDETGNRRRGNAAQQQQIADAIAAANQRALASIAPLRGALIELRDHATDPITENFIQSLLNDIDELGRRSKRVDQDLRRLREGVGESLVGGLAGFFDNLTDKTKSFGDAFHEMVNAILSDISRLVSRMLAEKIIFSLLGLGGASTGGQAGNLTQSSGRAAGGPARPPHGQLRGGISGVDSIPIMAMPKEYFIQTKAVDYYGADLFEALNKMDLPRINPRTFRNLALGGPASDGAAAAARPSRMQIDHHISVDNDGLLRVLKGRPGRDATLGHIHGNPRSVSSALRGRRA